jgi:hypothetical protein
MMHLHRPPGHRPDHATGDTAQLGAVEAGGMFGLLAREVPAGGRKLTNRDTLKVTAVRGPDAEARRQRQDGT